MVKVVTGVRDNNTAERSGLGPVYHKVEISPLRVQWGRQEGVWESEAVHSQQASPTTRERKCKLCKCWVLGKLEPFKGAFILQRKTRTHGWLLSSLQCLCPKPAWQATILSLSKTPGGSLRGNESSPEQLQPHCSSRATEGLIFRDEDWGGVGAQFPPKQSGHWRDPISRLDKCTDTCTPSPGTTAPKGLMHLQSFGGR